MGEIGNIILNKTKLESVQLDIILDLLEWYSVMVSYMLYVKELTLRKFRNILFIQI